MFYLTTHSTHFIYGYMASDIWLRTILIVREGTSCRHVGYSFRLTARVLLYAPSHRIAHSTAFVTPVVEHWLERETCERGTHGHVRYLKECIHMPPEIEYTLYIKPVVKGAPEPLVSNNPHSYILRKDPSLSGYSDSSP